MRTPPIPERSTSVVDCGRAAATDPQAHIRKLTFIAREVATPVAVAALAVADAVGRRSADL